MTQLSLIVNSIPRDLSEFAFFLIVGFTAGSIGLIWFYSSNLKLFGKKIIYYNSSFNYNPFKG